MPFDWEAHVANVIDSRLVESPGATAKNIFSTFSPPGGPFVYNTDCWAADLNLTGVSLYHTGGNSGSGGTMISPRHLVWANHLDADVGSDFLFVRKGNIPVWRTLAGKQRACCMNSPGYPGAQYWDDIMVGYLDEDVPESIASYKVLPATYDAYLPEFTGFLARDLPTLLIDNQQKAIIKTINNGGSGPTYFFSGAPIPAGDLREPYDEVLVSGDSGKPTLMVFAKNELAILNTHYFGGVGGSGPSFTARIDQINTAMAALDTDSTGYQVTLFNFAEFLAGMNGASYFSPLNWLLRWPYHARVLGPYVERTIRRGPSAAQATIRRGPSAVSQTIRRGPSEATSVIRRK